jgi:putrescine transport system permease protein
MVIFSSVRMGVSPQINALATVLLVVVAVVVMIAGRLVSQSRRLEMS